MNRTLIKAGERSLVQGEISRLTESRKQQQSRNTRSQYSAEVTGYDANQGHAIARNYAGTFYARSITTRALSKVSLSVPRQSTIGSADAKPV